MLPDPVSSQLLVLAGDVCAAGLRNYTSRLKEVTAPFEFVIYVPGNHEYYDESLSHTMKEVDSKIEAACSSIPNLICLQKKSVILGDTIFLGCTLWTNPPAVLWDTAPINDFRMICGNKHRTPITPKELVELHKDHASWLRREIKRAKGLKNVKQAVIITHHSPDIMLSRDCRGRGEEMNPWYYATDLKDLIEDPFIHTWCHGHTHESYLFKYPTGTLFATNALGYAHEDTNFNRSAVIKL
jgi:predicted MPP superfamily phosphohydrolase